MRRENKIIEYKRREDKIREDKNQTREENVR